MPNRVVVYIDGKNLYHGLRQARMKRYYWLDIRRMAELLIEPGQALEAVKYFSSRIKSPEAKRLRQAAFLDAIAMLPGVSCYYGYYQSEIEVCRRCALKRHVNTEKMTDVQLASHLVADCLMGRADVAMVVSGDSDLTPPIKLVKDQHSTARIVAVFPPRRISNHLKRAVDGFKHLGDDVLKVSLLPNEITKPNGHILTRPKEWA